MENHSCEIVPHRENFADRRVDRRFRFFNRIFPQIYDFAARKTNTIFNVQTLVLIHTR
jgi:hypothetical protein